MISELQKFRTPLFPEGSVTPRLYCTAIHKCPSRINKRAHPIGYKESDGTLVEGIQDGEPEVEPGVDL